jgi:hypothetical protein
MEAEIPFFRMHYTEHWEGEGPESHLSDATSNDFRVVCEFEAEDLEQAKRIAEGMTPFPAS